MAIRVFVGCAPNTEDAESQAVLEYTLRKHASEEIEITWMMLSRDPNSPWYSNPEKQEGWKTNRWATPFSGFRFAIPSVCNYEGKAIYTDSDVIYMDDIVKLWDQPFKPGKVVLAKGGSASWRYCVSLWDCAAVKKYIPPLDQLQKDPESHRKMMLMFSKNKEIVQRFEGDWNSLDASEHASLTDPELKALHYTHMSSQPHLKHAIPRLAKQGKKHWFDGAVKTHWRKDVIELFDKLLAEAEANGFPVSKYCNIQEYGVINKKLVGNQPIPSWATVK